MLKLTKKKFAQNFAILRKSTAAAGNISTRAFKWGIGCITSSIQICRYIHTYVYVV